MDRFDEPDLFVGQRPTGLAGSIASSRTNPTLGSNDTLQSFRNDGVLVRHSREHELQLVRHFRLQFKLRISLVVALKNTTMESMPPRR